MCWGQSYAPLHRQVAMLMLLHVHTGNTSHPNSLTPKRPLLPLTRCGSAAFCQCHASATNLLHHKAVPKSVTPSLSHTHTHTQHLHMHTVCHTHARTQKKKTHTHTHTHAHAHLLHRAARELPACHDDARMDEVADVADDGLLGLSFRRGHVNLRMSPAGAISIMLVASRSTMQEQ